MHINTTTKYSWDFTYVKTITLHIKGKITTKSIFKQLLNYAENYECDE